MKISEIRELIRLARRFGLEKTTHLDLNTLKTDHPKAALLLENIEGSFISTDENLFHQIYGKEGDQNNYRFLKSHTSNLLLELFFHPKVLESIQAHTTRGVLNAHKQYTLATLFQSLGNRNVSNAIANRSLTLAKHYQLTPIIISILEELTFFAVLRGNKTVYKKLNRELSRHVRILRDEITIRSLESDIRLQVVTTLAMNKTLYMSMESHVIMAKEIAGRNKNNFKIRSIAYRILYMCHQLRGNIQESLSTCKDAIQYISEDKIFYTKTRVGEFAIFEFENCLLLKDNVSGLEAAQRCEENIIHGSNMWFQFKEYEFLFAMQTEQFPLAEKYLQEMLSHPRLSVQLQHLRERWSIYKLYSDYVKWITDQEVDGRKQPAPGLLRYKRYKEIVGRFPSYHKDKSGFNVSIILLNIMLLLESERYDNIIEQMESLNTYRTRYLRNTGTNQMAILFKLLRIVASKDFDYERVMRSAKKYEAQLFAVHQSAQEMNEGLQVLSPIWIWNRIVTILQHRSGRY